MERAARSLFVASALAAFGCASASNESGGGGSGGVGGTGGSPGPVALECEIEGYPCAPADQTQDALELSEQYKGEIQVRRAAGDSYQVIADWLREQERVVDVVAADDRLRFRVEGGSAHWLYAISAAYPTPTLPPFEGGNAINSGSTALGVHAAPKAVLREDSSESNIKKKGLILEPFHFQFLSNTSEWRSRLEGLHDYEEVQYFRDRDIPDPYFGNWNDYRFVWVLSHGAYLPDRDDPDYTAIFSSKECGIDRWIGEEVGLQEMAADGTTRVAALMGLPRSEIESRLTPSQLQRWHAFRDAELRALTQNGRSCGVLEMPDAQLPVNDADGQPIVRAPAFIDYMYYDEAWFRSKYAGGLDNVLLYLSVCSSQTVPIPGGSAGPNSTFGWSEPVDAIQDNQTSDLLFERLIEQGDTVDYAFGKVQEAGLDSHQFEGKTTTLAPVSLGGGGRARIREIITIVDPDLGVPLPDQGAVLEAKAINGEGHTLVDVTVEVVGFGDRAPSEFSVQLFDGGGEPLSSVVPAQAEPLVIEMEIPEAIAEPTAVDIEARVSLPEESGSAVSKHPISVTVEPPGDCRFAVTVAGNQVTGQSNDVVNFQSADFDDGALLGINLEQTQTGRTVFLGPLLGAEFARVLGPGTFPAGVVGGIGLGGTDTSFYDSAMSVTLVVSEYTPGELLKGELSGMVLVAGPPPDYPEREEPVLITFEITVPPDFVSFLGYYECTIP